MHDKKTNRILAMLLGIFVALVCLAVLFQGPTASAYNANATLDKKSSAATGPAFDSPVPPGITFTRSAKYEVLSLLYKGTTIEMLKVPKGAIILDIWLKVTEDAAGKAGNATLTVGDGDDANRFLDTKNCTGNLAWRKSQNATDSPYAYEDADTIDIFLSSTNGTIVPGVTYEMGVTYKLPGSKDERDTFGL